MGMPRVSDKELQLDAEAYFDNAGNKAEAARSRGLNRRTYGDRLRTCEERFGMVFGKVAGGRLKEIDYESRDLPRTGTNAYYIVTSIQNNTHIHPGFNNMLAYKDYLEEFIPGNTCEIMIGTFSYQKAAYGNKAVKRGTSMPGDMAEEWYAKEAIEFISDKSVRLAPGLIWCGEQNILPTNKHPLRGMDDYNGRSSNLVPHAKISMDSVASMQDEATKFNYSTGTITQRNYIQKRAGIIAEQSHNYGFLVVTVTPDGNWWVRQCYIGRDDEIMDTGPDGVEGVYIQAGIVEERNVVDTIVWGDIHAAEMDIWVKELGWGPNGMLDQLNPKQQIMHDVFSMRNRSPHETKNFKRLYEKFVDGEESVEDEIILTADLIDYTTREKVETVIVHSNHDRHLDRWIEENDFRKDCLNARYFHKLSYEMLKALDEGYKDFNLMEFALKEKGEFKNVRFLAPDESYVICKTNKFEGIECGLHGDKGQNGSFGSTAGFTKLGRAVLKGHDHKAAINGQVFSVGACPTKFVYSSGPHSRSITHAVVYNNGTRSLVTMWGGAFRA